MAEDDDDVVDAIVAPQKFGAGVERQVNEAVVIAAHWIVAPAKIAPDRGARQGGVGCVHAVGAIKHPAQREISGRRRAIAFAFVRHDAAVLLAKDPALKSKRGEAVRVLLYLFERDAAVGYVRSG